MLRRLFWAGVVALAVSVILIVSISASGAGPAKPAIWQVQLPTDGAIYGPNQPLKHGVNGVEVKAVNVAASNATPYTKFRFDVWASYVPSSAMPFVGFAMEFVANDLTDPNSANRCSYPVWTNDGLDLDQTLVQPPLTAESELTSCILSFLIGGVHPQAPYDHVFLEVGIPGLDFARMPDGGWYEGSAQLVVAVSEDRRNADNFTCPQLTWAWGEADPLVRVTRTGTSWTVELIDASVTWDEVKTISHYSPNGRPRGCSGTRPLTTTAGSFGATFTWSKQ